MVAMASVVYTPHRNIRTYKIISPTALSGQLSGSSSRQLSGSSSRSTALSGQLSGSSSRPQDEGGSAVEFSPSNCNHGLVERSHITDARRSACSHQAPISLGGIQNVAFGRDCDHLVTFHCDELKYLHHFATNVDEISSCVSRCM